MRARVVTTAAVAGLFALVAPACSDGDPEAIDEDAMCAVLRDVDPGTAFGGADLAPRARAAVALGEVGEQGPEEIREALVVIEDRVADRPELARFPDLEIADPDYGLAYQAAYELSFDSQLSVAAALVERYAVDTCGMEASGLFDIEAVRAADLDGAEIPVLTQERLEGLRVDFDPAELGEFELAPFEIPSVEFNGDLGEFQLELPDIPEPDLGR